MTREKEQESLGKEKESWEIEQSFWEKEQTSWEEEQATWEKETSKHRPFTVRPICSSLNPNAKPKAANKPSSPSRQYNVTIPYHKVDSSMTIYYSLTNT